MGSKAERVRLALEGTIAQRDLTRDEARQLDAAIAVRIDDAVAQADFASAPLPNFAAVSPDPHRVLAGLDACGLDQRVALSPDPKTDD